MAKRAMKTERVETTIGDIQQVLIAGRFNRGEVAGILASLLAHALREGIPDPDRREALLQQVVDLIRHLWAAADARETPPPDSPVM